MATTLDNLYRRQFSSARSQNETEPDFDPVAQDQAVSGEQRQRRFLERLRAGSQMDLEAQARQRLQKEAEQKARDMAVRGISRILNVAEGATIVLLIVVYIEWTIRAIGGNLLGSKKLTKLEPLELFIWGMASLFLFSIVALVVVLIVIVARLMALDIKFWRQVLWTGLKTLLNI